MHATKAFTLVEVMIALTILAIATAMFGSALVSAYQVHNRTWEESRALEEIQRQIERIQATDWSAISSWNGQIFDVPGLSTPWTGQAKVGTITQQAASSDMAPFLIQAKWVDAEGPVSISMTYVHTNRGG